MSFIPFQFPSQEYVNATFRALTDSVLLPGLPEEYGYISGDMGAHEYLIYALDHYVAIQKQLFHPTIQLSFPTAKLLNAAAEQLVYANQVKLLDQQIVPESGMFSLLSKEDRLRTLSALENLKLDLFALPEPYRNNGGLIKHVTDALNRLSLFAYYSEWPAYGSTRLYPPQLRRLEFFPWGWEQVGYPGVAYGYRDFYGFLLKMEDIRSGSGNEEKA